MGVICNICGGEFSGGGPGPEWPHDTTKCARTTPQKLRQRIASLEAENARLREALEQCLGNLKALGAENGWGAEAARAALSPRPVTPAGNIAGTLELKAEIAALRRERDDALRAAWAVRDLATPPVSDEDVERAVAEAKRVRQEIEGERT